MTHRELKTPTEQQAFPGQDDFGRPIYGMELRDLFAGLAMAGMVAANADLSPVALVNGAYHMADLMMVRRKTPNEAEASRDAQG